MEGGDVTCRTGRGCRLFRSLNVTNVGSGCSRMTRNVSSTLSRTRTSPPKTQAGIGMNDRTAIPYTSARNALRKANHDGFKAFDVQDGVSMMFFKKTIKQPSVIACPICGREPQIETGENPSGISIYMLACPMNHIGTGWYRSAGRASEEWIVLTGKINKRKGADNESPAH